MKTETSAHLFKQASRFIPGGINTSLRRLSPPLVFSKARGSRIYDADGNEYIDYQMAFGAILLGHCHPKVNKRVFAQLEELDLAGAGTTELESKVAEKIVQHVPSAEMVHFCNTGSEATHHALRLSRAVTGKKKIGKFQGGYHGGHDYTLMNIITPSEKLGERDLNSAGILKEVAEQTLILNFNEIDSVEKIVKEHGDEMAAIIVEPIEHNVGCLLPKEGFLQRLRELTIEKDIILIFDEVITCFRHDIGGYQKICRVTPDLTALGKAIANGYPCSAICGRRDLMQKFNTAGGNVFFAGTYNAHPASMAAALATIEELESSHVHRYLFTLGDRLRSGLNRIFNELGVKAHATGFGSVFVTYFMEQPAERYIDLLRNNREMDETFKRNMTAHGVFMLPQAFKRCYISASHNEGDIDRTIEAAESVLKDQKKN